MQQNSNADGSQDGNAADVAFVPEPVCLFATFTPEGQLAPHTIYYLSELSSCGFSLHVALSGAQRLPDKLPSTLEKAAVTFWPRPNAGLDFGAWRHLIAQGCATGARKVLLANDSVFGPFSDLAPVFRDMAASGADVWGMVQSRAVLPHLQSWFLCFENGSFHAPALQRLFRQAFDGMTRDEVVWHGELGLAIACQAACLRTAARWSDRRLPFRKTATINPMHGRWRHLLHTGQVPFVKIELLRDNPFAVHSARDCQRHLPRKNNGFNPAWIEDFLEKNPARPERLRANLKGKILYNMVEELTGGFRRP